MQTNVCCCALALLMDHSGTGWVQCPALCKAEGGEWPEQPSSDPAGRACVGWAGMGCEQLCAQQGCRAGQAGPPAHLPCCTGPSISLYPSAGDTHTVLSTQLCDQALGGREREEPFHPARLQRVCLPWCPTPALSVLRGRNFIF